MKLKEAISQFRILLHDTSKEHDEYHATMRINQGIDLVCALLAGFASPLVLREDNFAEGDSLPHNFLRTAGEYPIERTGNTIHILTGKKTIPVRYFISYEHLDYKDLDSEMPFPHDALNDFVIRTAVKLALNRNEADISQDQSILSELQQAMTQAMG